jgi:hypothetical protein
MPVLTAAPASAGIPQALQQGATRGSATNCPGAARDFADKADANRRGPLVPRKLNELPPATAYMAVYRHVGRCEAPLTMVNYRKAPRR